MTLMRVLRTAHKTPVNVLTRKQTKKIHSHLEGQLLPHSLNWLSQPMERHDLQHPKKKMSWAAADPACFYCYSLSQRAQQTVLSHTPGEHRCAQVGRSYTVFFILFFSWPQCPCKQQLRKDVGANTRCSFTIKLTKERNAK